jgi:hypothetical protein
MLYIKHYGVPKSRRMEWFIQNFSRKPEGRKKPFRIPCCEWKYNIKDVTEMGCELDSSDIG